MSRVRYRVYMTPVADIEDGSYGTEIEVSDRVDASGIGSITKSIDAGDYDIGVYTYSDLTLRCYNHNGYFNDPGDRRSIFPVTRNRCKVRVDLIDMDSDGDETPFITYQGLINEEATRWNVETDQIEFKVLSRDSVIRNTKVSAGTIADGSLASTAISQILNVPSITAVLNYNVSDINVDLDFTIDDGSEFDNQSTRDVLNQLLLATNSVLLINESGDMIVSSRDENETDITYLYGHSDTYGRENIIKILNYNTGMHRMFTACKINDTEDEQADISATFGYRLKTISMPFVTDAGTEATIAERLSSRFSVPKMECQVVVSMEVSRSLDLLDRVSIDFPLRARPIEGAFLPVVGVTAIGDTDQPLPDTFGSFRMAPNIGWKMIEIVDDPKNFVSTLKLRQIGHTLSDGVFNAPMSCAIIGISKIDDSIICEGGTTCDGFEDAPVGAGIIGCTLIS
jgi:hypothetical protein